jgi:hypothetical protein
MGAGGLAAGVDAIRGAGYRRCATSRSAGQPIYCGGARHRPWRSGYAVARDVAFSDVYVVRWAGCWRCQATVTPYAWRRITAAGVSRVRCQRAVR